LDQKFRLSYDQAREVFKPLVDEAQASIGKMHLGDKLNNAVSSARSRRSWTRSPSMRRRLPRRS
jgi:hypothetical protein